MANPGADLAALNERIAQLEQRLDASESVQQIQRMKAHYGAITDRRYTGTGVAPRRGEGFGEGDDARLVAVQGWVRMQRRVQLA